MPSGPEGGRRCEAHGLVYDPRLTRGCVLCRRSAPGDIAIQPARSISWGSIAAVLLMLTVVGGAWLYVTLGTREAPAAPMAHGAVARDSHGARDEGRAQPAGPTRDAGPVEPVEPEEPDEPAREEERAEAELPKQGASTALHPLDPGMWAEIEGPFELADATESATRALAEGWGVQIYLSRTPIVNIEGGKLTGVRPDQAQIRAAALALARALAIYPVRFIAGIGFKRLLLIDEVKHKGVPAAAFVMAPAAVMVADPDGLLEEYRVHHEIFHFADYRLHGRPPRDEEWNALNVPGVRYGGGGRRVVSQTQGTYETMQEPRTDLPGFVTLYSQAAPEEDRAEVFATLLTRRPFAAERMARDPVIAAKARYVLESLERIHEGTRRRLGHPSR